MLSLSGLRTVIWMEGIDDFGRAGASSDAVIAAVRDVAGRIHAHVLFPDLPPRFEAPLRILMATATSSLKGTNGN